MSKLFDNSDEAMEFLINFNRNLILNRKDYIKKYYKARDVHESILNSMINYIDSGKFSINEYFNLIADDIRKETNNLDIELDTNKYNDMTILNELFFYKNNNKMPSLTEIYIEKKKFRQDDKVNMLYAMRDSIVGLFKIIDYDSRNGYVTYQDVFTNKKYKVIDVSMSSLGELYKKEERYIYNRLLDYDGLLFGTGLPCIISGKNKKLKDFIANHKYNDCSDFSRCLILYDIANSDNKITMKNYNNY